LQPFIGIVFIQLGWLAEKLNIQNQKNMMKKIYEKPLVETYEVMSERGFVQSDFNSGFIVPGGSDNGGEDEWV